MSSDLVNNNSAWERQVLEAGKRRAVEQAVAQARQEERERLGGLTIDELRRIKGLLGYGDDNGRLLSKIEAALAAVEAKLAGKEKTDED